GAGHLHELSAGAQGGASLVRVTSIEGQRALERSCRAEHEGVLSGRSRKLRRGGQAAFSGPAGKGGRGPTRRVERIGQLDQPAAERELVGRRGRSHAEEGAGQSHVDATRS